MTARAVARRPRNELELIADAEGALDQVQAKLDRARRLIQRRHYVTAGTVVGELRRDALRAIDELHHPQRHPRISVRGVLCRPGRRRHPLEVLPVTHGQLPDPFDPVELSATPELAALPAVLPLPDAGCLHLYTAVAQDAAGDDVDVLVVQILRPNVLAVSIMLDAPTTLALQAIIDAALPELGVTFEGDELDGMDTERAEA